MPPIQAGDVVKLNEPDYMYGRGPLILRVTKVGRVQPLRDGEWLDLEGVELRPDGTQLGQEAREVLVRMTALRGGIQRRGQGKS
jgi:hypothetical protein